MRQTRYDKDFGAGENNHGLFQVHEIVDQKPEENEQEKTMTNCTCLECVQEEKRFRMRAWAVVLFMIGVAMLTVVLFR